MGTLVSDSFFGGCFLSRLPCLNCLFRSLLFCCCFLLRGIYRNVFIKLTGQIGKVDLFLRLGSIGSDPVERYVLHPFRSPLCGDISRRIL